MKRYKLDGYTVVEHDLDVWRHSAQAERPAQAGDPVWVESRTSFSTCDVRCKTFYVVDGRPVAVSEPCPHGFIVVVGEVFSSDVREVLAFLGLGAGPRATTYPKADPFPAEPDLRVGLSDLGFTPGSVGLTTMSQAADGFAKALADMQTQILRVFGVPGQALRQPHNPTTQIRLMGDELSLKDLLSSIDQVKRADKVAPQTLYVGVPVVPTRRIGFARGAFPLLTPRELAQAQGMPTPTPPADLCGTCGHPMDEHGPFYGCTLDECDCRRLATGYNERP